MGSKSMSLVYSPYAVQFELANKGSSSQTIIQKKSDKLSTMFSNNNCATSSQAYSYPRHDIYRGALSGVTTFDSSSFQATS